MAILTTTQAGLNFIGGTTFIQTGTTTLMAIATNGNIQFSQYGAGTLVTDASGNITSAPAGPGNVGYLPLTAGSSYPLTGDLWLDDNSGASPSLYLQNGSNNYWRLLNGSTGIFSLKEGTSDRITILPGGNVGIGVTGPLSKLHVNGGNISIQNVDSSSPYTASGKLRFLGRYDRYLGGINTVNTGSYAEYDNGLDFYVQRDTFDAAGHFAMRINHLGNVGIGDVSPTSISANTFSLSVNSSRNDLSGALISKANGTVKHQQYWDSSGYSFNLSAGNFQFNGGNVGIGTTSPDSKLEVAGGSTGIILSNLGDSSAYDAVRITYSGYNSGTPEFIFQPKTAPGSGTTNTYFRFKTQGSVGQNIANVTVDGNVGIGTTLPSAKLHVDSSTAFSLTSVAGDTLFLSDDTNPSALNGVGASIGFSGPQEVQRQAAIAALRTGADHDHIGLAFYTHPGTSNDETIVEQMRITDSGNVGIGTSTPNAKLDIQGTQGQLFSVTDDLSGSIFAVADISGVPILDVNSSGASNFDGTIESSGNITCHKDAPKIILKDTGTGNAMTSEFSFHDGNGVSRGYLGYGSSGNSTMYLQNTLGDLQFHTSSALNLTLSGTSATFAGNVRVLGQSLFLSNSSVFNKITLNGTDMEIWSGALFPSIDITNTGLLKFGAYALSGAGTPTKLLGVDNSGNVLTTVSGGSLPGGPYLPLSGGTMTGNIHYSGTNKATFGTAASPELKIYNQSTSYNILESSIKFDLNVLELDINGVNGTTPIADLGPTDCRFAYSGAYKLYTTTTGITVANTIDFGGGNNDGIIEVSGSGDLIFKYKGSDPALTLDGGAIKTIVHNRLDALGIVSISNPSNNESKLNIRDDGTNGHIAFENSSEINGIIASGTDLINFRVGDGISMSDSPVLTLFSNRVGINTTSPNSNVALDIDGRVLIKDSTGVADLYLGNYATANHFRFHTNNANTYFDMNCGNIYWRDGGSTRYTFFPSTANMTVNGTITQNSDARVKENIVEISDCISKVQAMKGVYYNRTDFNTEATKVGVIAQDVEAVLPELIIESPEDGLKSVAYSELTAVLINAIKEQQEIIEDLKTRIEQLEN